MSRQNSDKLEWALNFFSFPTLSTLVFKPDIDLFASRLNKQLPVFVSWHPEPGCYAVVFLWTPFKCYAFPPFCLIPRVLEKMEREYVDQFLLIAPVWPMQTWFPLLLRTS